MPLTPNANDRFSLPVKSAPPALNAPSAAHPLSQTFGVLITEIAAQLEPLTTILKRHGISKSQWLALRKHPSFEKALDEQVKAFSSLGNMPARIKLKAQLLTEMLLDQMYDIAHHPAYAPSARVSAFSMITKLTGLERPEDAAPPRKVSLTINLADGRSKSAETVTVEAIRDRDAIAGRSEFTFTEAGGDDGDGISKLGYMGGRGRDGDGAGAVDDSESALAEADETAAPASLGWYDFKAVQGTQPRNHVSPEGAFRHSRDEPSVDETAPPSRAAVPTRQPAAAPPSIGARVSALRAAQKLTT